MLFLLSFWLFFSKQRLKKSVPLHDDKFNVDYSLQDTYKWKK